MNQAYETSSWERVSYEPDEELAALNREFVARNISPGGCADLLAIAIFFVRLQELMDERKDRDQPCCKANSAPRKRLTLTWKN